MRCLAWLWAIGLAAPVQASGVPGPATVAAEVTVAGPTIVAFLPPEARQPGAEGASEAVAHVGFALADTRRCLGAKAVRFETVYADRVLLQGGVRGRQTFDVRQLGQGVGAVLAEPGRPATVIHTEVGPSSLAHQLPQAVFEYWRVAGCRRE